ncbi:MAG: glucokinase [Desulfomonilaceae bacterium]
MPETVSGCVDQAGVESSDERLVLAGDIGGTNTRFGLYRPDRDRPESVASATYASSSLSSLEDGIERFLQEHPARISAACFGVAGPVIKGVCNVTNLPWVVSEERIKERFAFEQAALVNDLLATANGIELLTADDLLVLQAGEADPNGNAAILAPGTGLGVGFLFNIQGVLHPVASQGGHVDFAPTTDAEISLLQALRKKFSRVSLERVASGSGLVEMYRTLRDARQTPGGFGDGIDQLDTLSPRDVTTRAVEGRDPLCVETARLFLRIVGSAAGNLILMSMATKGLYLAGGVLPHLAPLIHEGILLEALLEKGRFRDLLMRVPVAVILNQQTGLMGAARLAAKSAALGR